MKIGITLDEIYEKIGEKEIQTIGGVPLEIEEEKEPEKKPVKSKKKS